jgi:tRNA threonylcarbamoyladenosine biosynthesis protein TsaB
MKLLAIDTTTDACSIALQVDEEINEWHHVEARAHTRILVPMIRKVLEKARLRSSELDAVVLGNGPGSFIGMRISASVAQGFCFAAGLSLVPVSSLAAIALQVILENEADRVAVAQDARMDEVYFASYRRDVDGLPAAEREEQIVPVTENDLLAGRGWTAAGGGWERYPQLAAANASQLSHISNVRLPRARFLLPLAVRDLQNGLAIVPQELSPAYLRTKVADTSAGAS